MPSENGNADTPTHVQYTRLPVSVPCPVAVVPGTPHTLDANGEPIPEAMRTESCNVQAHWAIGAAICCDVHARQASELLGIDFDEVQGNYALCDCERVPWEERLRFPQEGGSEAPHL